MSYLDGSEDPRRKALLTGTALSPDPMSSGNAATNFLPAPGGAGLSDAAGPLPILRNLAGATAREATTIASDRAARGDFSVMDALPNPEKVAQDARKNTTTGPASPDPISQPAPTREPAALPTAPPLPKRFREMFPEAATQYDGVAQQNAPPPKASAASIEKVAKEFPEIANAYELGGVEGLTKRKASSFMDKFSETYNENVENALLGVDLLSSDAAGRTETAEALYGLAKRTPAKDIGYKPDSASMFMQKGFWADIAASWSYSMSALGVGATAGGVAGSVIPGAGTVGGALTGGAIVGTSADALSQMGGTFKDAYIAYRDQGKSPQEASKLAYEVAKVDGAKTGALSGVSLLAARLPFHKLLGKMAPKGPIGKTITNAAGETFLLEPFIEGGDQLLSNAIAQETYDRNRDLFEGVPTAAVMGALASTPMAALGAATGVRSAGRREDGGTPPPADDSIAIDTETQPDPPATPRGDFVRSQLERLSQLEEEKTKKDPSYAGDARIGEAFNFFKYLAQGETILSDVVALPADQRNNPANVAKRQDAQRRLALLDTMMNPKRDLLRPLWVLWEKPSGKRPGRIALVETTEDGVPVIETGAYGAKFMRLKSGERVMYSAEKLRDIGETEQTNLLLTPEVSAQTRELISQMRAELAQRRIDYINQRLLTDETSTPKRVTDQGAGQRRVDANREGMPPSTAEKVAAVEMLEGFGTDRQIGSDQVPPSRQIADGTLDNVRSPKVAPNIDSAPASGDAIAAVNAAMREAADNERRGAETEAARIAATDATRGTLDAARRIMIGGARTADELPDAIVARVEKIRNTRKTLLAASQARGNRLDARPLPPDGIYYRSDLEDAGVPAEDIEALFARAVAPQEDNLLSQDTADAGLTPRQEMLDRADRENHHGAEVRQSRDPNTSTTQETIESILRYVPEEQRPAMQRFLDDLAKSLPGGLSGLDVIDLATWMDRQTDPRFRDPRTRSVFLQRWYTVLGQRIVGAALGLKAGALKGDSLRVIAHELLHFSRWSLRLDRNAMRMLWDAVPDNHPTKRRIAELYGTDFPDPALLGEELAAELFADMISGIYKPPKGFLANVFRRVVRLIKGAFRGTLGKNVLDTFFANIDADYGVRLNQATDAPNYGAAMAARGGGLYSKLLRTLEMGRSEKFLPEQATADQYLGRLRNLATSGKISMDEMLWTGLYEHLAKLSADRSTNSPPMIPIDDLISFVRNNQVSLTLLKSPNGGERRRTIAELDFEPQYEPADFESTTDSFDSLDGLPRHIAEVVVNGVTNDIRARFRSPNESGVRLNHDLLLSGDAEVIKNAVQYARGFIDQGRYEEDLHPLDREDYAREVDEDGYINRDLVETFNWNTFDAYMRVLDYVSRRPEFAAELRRVAGLNNGEVTIRNLANVVFGTIVNLRGKQREGTLQGSTIPLITENRIDMAFRDMIGPNPDGTVRVLATDYVSLDSLPSIDFFNYLILSRYTAYVPNPTVAGLTSSWRDAPDDMLASVRTDVYSALEEQSLNIANTNLAQDTSDYGNNAEVYTFDGNYFLFEDGEFAGEYSSMSSITDIINQQRYENEAEWHREQMAEMQAEEDAEDSGEEGTGVRWEGTQSLDFDNEDKTANTYSRSKSYDEFLLKWDTPAIGGRPLMGLSLNSTHWNNVANVLAHVRGKYLTGVQIGGESKDFFVAMEFQSDHEKAVRRGVKNNSFPEGAEPLVEYRRRVLIDDIAAAQKSMVSNVFRAMGDVGYNKLNDMATIRAAVKLVSIDPLGFIMRHKLPVYKALVSAQGGSKSLLDRTLESLTKIDTMAQTLSDLDALSAARQMDGTSAAPFVNIKNVQQSGWPLAMAKAMIEKSVQDGKDGFAWLTAPMIAAARGADSVAGRIRITLDPSRTVKHIGRDGFADWQAEDDGTVMDTAQQLTFPSGRGPLTFDAANMQSPPTSISIDVIDFVTLPDGRVEQRLNPNGGAKRFSDIDQLSGYLGPTGFKAALEGGLLSKGTVELGGTAQEDSFIFDQSDREQFAGLMDLYDKQLPKAVQTFFERMGFVKKGQMAVRRVPVMLDEYVSGTRESGQLAASVWYVDISPEVRQAILDDSIPLFSRGGHIPQATPGTSPRAVIKRAGGMARLVEPLISWTNWAQRGVGSPRENFLAAYSAFDRYSVKSAARIRGIGKTKTAYELGNHFERHQYAQVGPDEVGIIPEDYHSAVSGALGKYGQAMIRLLSPLSQDALELLPRVLQADPSLPRDAEGRLRLPRNSGLTPALIRALRDNTDAVLQYVQRSFAEGGVAPSDIPKRLSNYFPHFYKLQGDFGGRRARRGLHGLERRQAFVDFLNAAGIGSKIDPKDPTSVNAAEEIAEKILEERNMPIWGFDIARVLEGRAYKVTTSERERFIKIGPYTEVKTTSQGRTVMMRLADFLNDDPQEVMQRYVSNAVRRAEFVKRFGAKGERINEMLGKIDEERVKQGLNPLTASERRDIIYQVRSNVGMAGKSYPVNNPRIYTSQQALITAANLVFLSLSAIASLGELFTPAIRMGLRGQLIASQRQFRELFRTGKTTLKAMAEAAMTEGSVFDYKPENRVFKVVGGDKWRSFKAAFEFDNSDVRQFATDLGIIHSRMQYALQTVAEENANYTIEKVNELFFRKNLLQPLTEMQQVAATEAAVRSLPHWARKAANGSARYARYLREVGLEAADLVGFNPDNPGETSTPKINAAIRQLADETIVNPNPGNRPAWMNDPRFQVVAHIKSFAAGFANTVIQRVMRETFVQGNMMPLVYFAAYAWGQAMIYEWREWMRWGEEGNPFYNKLGLKQDDPMRTLFVAFDRSGVLGMWQWLSEIFTGARTGNIASLPEAMIPVIGFVGHLVEGVSYATDYMITGGEEAGQLRRAISSFTKAIPLLNQAGQLRIDLIDYLGGPPKNRKGGGRKALDEQFGGFDFNAPGAGGDVFSIEDFRSFNVR